jgi:glutathione S-transferase
MTKPITYYDIKFTTGLCSSPNTWRIRYALNIKGLPYKTEWLSFLEIPKVLEANGTPKSESEGYTLPAILDPNTNKAIGDSIPIMEYLDAQYPDTPQLLSAETREAQLAFINNIGKKVNMTRFPFSIYQIFLITLPEDQGHFRTAREKNFGGRKLEDIEPKDPEERKAKFEAIKGALDAAAAALEEHAPGKTFYGGDSPVFVDTDLAGTLMCVKNIHGEDSELWKFMMAQNDGRWVKYVAAMDKYTSGQ